MNVQDRTGALRRLAFRLSRALAGYIPGGRISAFGKGEGQIGSVLVVNLDRQPQRWRRVLRELGRFTTHDGAPLKSMARRLVAIDARDGRAVAATADVDSTYRIRDHLYVQPDSKLEACFGANEAVRMTKQEVAVARSHVEAWKVVATGVEQHVLVVEDDIWFRRGAAAIIDRGWRAAFKHCADERGPRLLYLSYEDAGGTAERIELGDGLFRPVRGLWHLSGYILSREGAATLLQSLPVVGPVDLWINYHYEALGALAFSSPVIEQRQDAGSDNVYSILPYLARAGTIDASSAILPTDQSSTGPVLAWSAEDGPESLAMALSMLGLRVRVFDRTEEEVVVQDLSSLLETFDALVNAPLSLSALVALSSRASTKFVVEEAVQASVRRVHLMPAERIGLLPHGTRYGWGPLCAILGIAEPVEDFPVGAVPNIRLFRDDRSGKARRAAYSRQRHSACALDDSPWVLPPKAAWRPTMAAEPRGPGEGRRLVHAKLTMAPSSFRTLAETFPGNMASFTREGLVHGEEGARLLVARTGTGSRPYSSGAFASVATFEYGRFEAEMKAAAGSGLLTGFFLHRDAPRQEIDVEISGADPTRMLVNVYFNPGDVGTTLAFGYRGSLCRINLGFDATLDFHRYTIEWRPGYIAWSVDGKIVHERVGWDPTPVPHLPMRLHANLWVPRSEELAGRIDDSSLPATATFRTVSVWA